MNERHAMCGFVIVQLNSSWRQHTPVFSSSLRRTGHDPSQMYLSPFSTALVSSHSHCRTQFTHESLMLDFSQNFTTGFLSWLSSICSFSNFTLFCLYSHICSLFSVHTFYNQRCVHSCVCACQWNKDWVWLCSLDINGRSVTSCATHTRLQATVNGTYMF